MYSRDERFRPETRDRSPVRIPTSLEGRPPYQEILIHLKHASVACAQTFSVIIPLVGLYTLRSVCHSNRTRQRSRSRRNHGCGLRHLPTIREGDWLRLWNSLGIGVAYDVWLEPAASLAGRHEPRRSRLFFGACAFPASPLYQNCIKTPADSSPLELLSSEKQILQVFESN